MPVLVLFKGHPGTGKSSTAKALARTLRWPVIDKDDSKDALASAVGLSDEDANQLAYRIMVQHVVTQLDIGISLIVDSPLSRMEQFHALASPAKKHGYQILVVELVCSDVTVWTKRLEERARQDKGSHKPGGAAEMQMILDRYHGCDRWTEEIPSQEVLHIDTCKLDSQKAAQIVKDVLDSWASRPLQADDDMFLNSG